VTEFGFTEQHAKRLASAIRGALPSDIPLRIVSAEVYLEAETPKSWSQRPNMRVVVVGIPPLNNMMVKIDDEPFQTFLGHPDLE
jgi:hypothetical protein